MLRSICKKLPYRTNLANIIKYPFSEINSEKTFTQNKSQNSRTNARFLFSKRKGVKEEVDAPDDVFDTFGKPQKGAQDKDNSQYAPDDDIHSKRFIDISKLGGEDTFLNLRNELYKFTFDSTMHSVKVNLDDVNIVNIENDETFHRTPKLAHNLDVILRRPGIYPIESLLPLQPDGGKFLKNIYQPDQIDFDRIPPYVPPSEDKLLLKFAKESKIKYVMSTSTISNVLSHLYYLFSSFRSPYFGNISDAYASEPKKYMISQRKPITNFLRKIDPEAGIYALDNDSGLFQYENNILMQIGKVIERSLTLPPEVFNQALLKDSPYDESQKINDDHHRFMKLNNEICLRSQIDCYDINHETGEPFVFEIKTRSACPIRYDLPNYQDYLDYAITQYRGLHSSFEREYYDLIRGGFLKYSFQLKIGRMDGAFIAYHNTKEIAGFEYVKTTEIERRIFGTQLYADAVFVSCSKLLIILLDNILNAVKDEKYEMLKIGFYADSNHKKMVIFVELFEDSFSWSKHSLIQASEEIKDEFDYFTKHTSFKNKVLKFEFHMQVYINGILQKGTGHELTKGDQIEIKYRFEDKGKAQFHDYMNFLHEAYKFDALNLDLSYIGAWIR